MFFVLFAQSPDSLSGGAGWVGAGLLGMVMAWLLLRHLPDKDRQLERIIAEHTATEREQRKVHSELEYQQRKEYQETLQMLMAHFKGLMDSLTAAIKDDLHELQNTILDATKKGGEQ